MILELRVACPICRAHPGEACRPHPTTVGACHEARSRVARRTVCHPLPAEVHCIDR
ncbi:MAG: hypothetical protein M9891_03475 [Austwickia sp.]|nr:hypothetical protein [Actinomycetota bacterium]MCB1255076.1 hypothetical protein [Austwickia sp.]MCO5308349.1 hypothetical protein [Austwickia sp.]